MTFVLFGLLIASFAVWGIGDIFRGAGQSSAILEVGDIKVDRQDFSRELNREMNRLSERFGERLDGEQARTLGLVDQVMGRMIGRALFDQTAEDLKLVVTEDQVRQRIRGEPAFKDELNRFDRGRFVRALQASNLTEQEYVSTLRRDIVRQQIAGALTNAVTAPNTLADALYRYRAERRVAKVLIIPNESIEDLPTPDEASLEAYHKEFSAQFMAPERRALTVLELRPQDLADEIAVPEARVREEFEARKAEFGTPERRQIEQFVVTDEAVARKASGRISEGVTFAAAAKDATGNEPVDLGLIERSGLPKELADAAFALEPGAASEPIRSTFGWHILRVVKVEPGKEANFDDVRETLAADIAMGQAIDSMVSMANQLDDELAGGATLDEAAERLGLTVRRIEAIDRQGKDPNGVAIENIPGGRFLEVAFQTAPGEESLLNELDDGSYFALRVDRVTPAQVRPLGEVRELVVQLWRDAQRAERARALANDIVDKARNGASLESLAEAGGYSVATTQPVSRFETNPGIALASGLPAKLFQLSAGEIATVTAPDRQLVIELDSVQAAQPGADEKEVSALRNGLAAAMRGDVIEQFVAAQRLRHSVRVNQRMVDDVVSAF